MNFQIVYSKNGLWYCEYMTWWNEVQSFVKQNRQKCLILSIQKKYKFISTPGKSYNSEGIQYIMQGMRRIKNESGLWWSAKFVAHTAGGYLGLKLGCLVHNVCMIYKKSMMPIKIFLDRRGK